MGTKIIAVREGSGYALAGFKQGDVLIQVNQTDCTASLTGCAILAGIFEKPQRFSYVVNRNGKPVRQVCSVIGTVSQKFPPDPFELREMEQKKAFPEFKNLSDKFAVLLQYLVKVKAEKLPPEKGIENFTLPSPQREIVLFKKLSEPLLKTALPFILAHADGFTLKINKEGFYDLAIKGYQQGLTKKGRWPHAISSILASLQGKDALQGIAVLNNSVMLNDSVMAEGWAFSFMEVDALRERIRTAERPVPVYPDDVGRHNTTFLVHYKLILQEKYSSADKKELIDLFSKLE